MITFDRNTHDLDRLEADIRKSRLPDTEGFFFGNSDGSEQPDDLAFIEKARKAVSDGVVASYMHNKVATDLGKIGVLVALESTGDHGKLAGVGKELAMHVAAANPQFLDVASVDKSALERERDVLREQARASGKPDNVIEKMVEGRLRKFYEDVVLLEQTYVRDQESRVKQVIDAAAKEIGAPVRVTGFVRFALGEGIAREPA